MRPHAAALAVFLAALAGCEGRSSTPEAGADTAAPKRTTLAEFGSLRWLEGRWAGSENGANPFYEGYRVLDDSTMQTLTFADSSFTTVSDSGVKRWRDGIISSGSGAVVTALDSNSVRFEAARNSYTWTRTSPTTWTALLEWLDDGGKAQRKTYLMIRRGE